MGERRPGAVRGAGGAGATARMGARCAGCRRGRGRWGQSRGSGSGLAPWHPSGSPGQTSPRACPVSSNRLAIARRSPAALFHSQQVWGCRLGLWRTGSAQQWPEARAPRGGMPRSSSRRCSHPQQPATLQGTERSAEQATAGAAAGE